MSPTPSCQLSLSLEILEPELKATVDSDPGTEEEGNGASLSEGTLEIVCL